MNVFSSSSHQFININAFVNQENHWAINQEIQNACNKVNPLKVLPSLDLLGYAIAWFNLYNDPKFEIQSSLAVKWQIYFAAHSEQLADGTIQLDGNFNYACLNGKDLALFYRILNSYQNHEKGVKGTNAIFPIIVHHLENYIFDLCVSDEVKARDFLSGLLDHQNPNLYTYTDPSLTPLIERMRKKIFEIAKGHEEYNKRQPLTNATYPNEILPLIMAFVGDPQTTIKVCRAFRAATLASCGTFLEGFREVDLLDIQERLIFSLSDTPENRLVRLGSTYREELTPKTDETDLERFHRLRTIYNIFMNYTRLQRKYFFARDPRFFSEHGLIPTLPPINPTLANYPTPALNRIQMINNARKAAEDRHLVEFCKNLPLHVQTALYEKNPDQTLDRLPNAITYDDLPEASGNPLHPALHRFQGEFHPRVLLFLNQQIGQMFAMIATQPIEMLNFLNQQRFAEGLPLLTTEDLQPEAFVNQVIANNPQFREESQQLFAQELLKINASYFNSLDPDQQAEHLRKRLASSQVVDQITVLENLHVHIYPPEIKLLTKLEVLLPMIGAYLPREVGELRNLRTLYFSINESKDFPHWIGNLRQLQSLLYTTHLTLDGSRSSKIYDREVLARLTNLRRLTITNHHLTTVPAEFEVLHTLEVLDIRQSKIRTLPIEIFRRLANLRELHLLHGFPQSEIDALHAARPDLEIRTFGF